MTTAHWFTHLDSRDPTGVGSVRRYNPSEMFRDIVPPNTNLKAPTLFTFGGTNPTTLVYEIPENEQ